MEASCSFKFIVGSACSYDRQDRSKLFEVVPLVSCNKDVQGHKSAWCFAGVENESELILARAGIFYMSAKDINALTIFPFHRSELGEGARIPTEFQMIVEMSALISLEIERAVQEVGGTTDTKEDLAFVTLQSKQYINSWKAHLLRSTNQDESRPDVIDELDETSALLVLDRAMKYLPKKFRESQTDWFGKRDLPWHITVATRKGNDGKIEMMTFVHLFETCNQDSSAVLAILNDVFRRLKDVMPHLQSIYLRQDNAGYYHCALTLVTASKVAELKNLFLRRIDFQIPKEGRDLAIGKLQRSNPIWPSI